MLWSKFKENYEFCCKSWNKYLGDGEELKRYLDEKPNGYLWTSFKFLDIYFRSFGQTVFVNNPFLGLVFLLAISISNPTAGLGCALGGFISTGTDFLLGLHPITHLESGVSSFNGSLIGTVLCALFPLVDASQLDLWIGVCFGSLISVFISSALNNSLGQINVPFMTLPFNIVALVSFSSWQSDQVSPLEVELEATNSSVEVLRMMEGTILSMGQVFAIPGLTPSIIMWVAVILYSPLLALFSLLGATIGSSLPLLLLDAGDYETVYSGLWGYSCLLSMACVSWAVFPASPNSLLAGLVNTVATVFTQKALLRVLGKMSLPVFTLPFTLPSLIVILSWNKRRKSSEGLKNTTV